MTRRLGPLAVLLLLVAAFAAGCGDDEGSDSSTSNDSPAVTSTTADDAAPEETATEPAAEPADGSENVEQSIQACKDAIDSNPSVSDDIKEDLRTICDKVGEDPESVQAASREICEKIVEESVPEGDVRDQAKEACASAGG